MPTKATQDICEMLLLMVPFGQGDSMKPLLLMGSVVQKVLEKYEIAF